MRTAFIETLFTLAKEDKRIVLVVGDLGFGVVTPFKDELPNQYLNAGVAEQNMIGLAAGMAMCGKIVFTYSIANFPTLRCIEHIRNDVCFHQANVTIVSVGGGLVYGALGHTHHATEDLAIMRALPNMRVIAPGDPIEAGLATRAIIARPGPCYLRLGKTGEPHIHQPDIEFQIGKAITVREGRDLTLVATGGLLYSAVQIAEQLSQRGIQARVLSMHTIKPLDTEAVLTAARETAAIVTIEEHSVVGGLGSAVIEALADSGAINVRIKRIGLPPEFVSEVGSQRHLLDVYSLSIDKILQTVEQFLSDKDAL